MDVMQSSSAASQSGDASSAAFSITKAAIGDSLKEYETQYFGFTPKSFIDGVYNALGDYLYDCVDAMDKYIASEAEQGKHPVSAEAIRESSDRLLAYLQFAFDKAFDRLETYLMKNIFHIPSHVTLPEDKVHLEITATESDEVKIDAELEELRESIRNARFVNAALQQWTHDVQKVQQLLDGFHDELERFQKTCQQANVPDLRESVIFMASRAQKLLDLCGTLHFSFLLSMQKRTLQDEEESEIPAKLVKPMDGKAKSSTDSL
ncbi:protein MIS12 homolog [Diadema antillarum]|uniref:protein MIS12 homolog n=1 Tax=Diadema antillarum TaxID=105358 RepID=UPI003A8C76F7